MGLCLWLAGRASAIPIHPTAKQILNDAASPAIDYIPARAGWNGPETPSLRSTSPDMGRLARTAQVEANRMALWDILTPDIRIWALIGALILSLRMFSERTVREKPKLALVGQPGTEHPPSQLKAA